MMNDEKSYVVVNIFLQIAVFLRKFSRNIHLGVQFNKVKVFKLFKKNFTTNFFLEISSNIFVRLPLNVLIVYQERENKRSSSNTHTHTHTHTNKATGDGLCSTKRVALQELICFIILGKRFMKYFKQGSLA